jgi:hypothetical protein
MDSQFNFVDGYYGIDKMLNPKLKGYSIFQKKDNKQKIFINMESM